MGFDWKIADFILDRLGVQPGQTVLDPFCGAGTTLVQSKKLGINSIGVDVNPVCLLASQVKTTWTLNPSVLSRTLERIIEYAVEIELEPSLNADPALHYLVDSGMIQRGWISFYKAKKIMALQQAIRRASTSIEHRKFFSLALVSAVVQRIADIRFGPEVYCLSEPKRSRVTASFRAIAEIMIMDLENVRATKTKPAFVRTILGDSRQRSILKTATLHGADFLCTSPPYPNEHDYTRCTRLELAILGHVRDKTELRELKRQMLRCNTKGIYKSDSDAQYSARHQSVQRIATELDKRAQNYSDGFSRLYGRMVREYFGGMVCHFRSVANAIPPGARCAYVVRDAQALLGVYIDTPGILAEIATSKEQGFQLEETIEWKRVKGTMGIRVLSEKILILRKPLR
jgi:hypothetical protein